MWAPRKRQLKDLDDDQPDPGVPETCFESGPPPPLNVLISGCHINENM